MKRFNLKYFFLLTIPFLLLSCSKKNPLDDKEYMIFGKYAGFCMGENCIEIFKLSDGKIYEDSEDNYPELEPYIGEFVKLTSTQYNLAKDIPESLPEELFDEDNQVFGTPDAYDQGGYYIEIKTSTDHQYWLIDTDKNNVPAYLHELMDELKATIENLQ